VAAKTGAVVVEAVSQEILDLPEALTYCDGDRELLEEVIRLFRKTWPTALVDLRASFKAGNAEKLSIDAHRLKGQASVLCASRVVGEAQRLENLGEEGDLAHAGSALDALTAALTQLDQALSKAKVR
jgi:HPt (histidine-containing phosphotransfer) domain-containing protein